MFYKIWSFNSRKLMLNPHFNNILRFYQTHYQVLNLRRNCTPKEIKDAYIALSKSYHPDINKGKHSHKKFLAINEAYKVLGKPESRKDYDLGLPNTGDSSNIFYREVHASPDPYKDPIFWHNKKKWDPYKNPDYYGIKGIKKVSNQTVMFACILLVMIGVSLQFYLIINSFTFQREDLLKKSIEASRLHRETRQMALVNDNEKQIELLKIRLNHNMLNKGSGSDK